LKWQKIVIYRFPEYLACGVVRSDVDFVANTLAFSGCNGEEYVEAYPRSKSASDASIPVGKGHCCPHNPDRRTFEYGRDFCSRSPGDRAKKN
jgi:hypothetical protein